MVVEIPSAVQSYSWLDSRLLSKTSRSLSNVSKLITSSPPNNNGVDVVVAVVCAFARVANKRFPAFVLCTPSIKPDSVRLLSKLNQKIYLEFQKNSNKKLTHQLHRHRRQPQQDRHAIRHHRPNRQQNMGAMRPVEICNRSTRRTQRWPFLWTFHPANHIEMPP